EQVGLLIDEYAQMISDPKGAPSIVDADRAKWDYHPIMASPQVLPKKAGQGRFYFSDPQNHFGVILDQMKNYAARRCVWIDQSLLSSYQPPLPPQIAFENPAEGTKSAVTIRIQSKFENPNQKVRWRLAEI